jgi:hypothetical protein
LAFIRTAPPTVPGMLIPNSRPPSPQPAAFAAADGRRTPPPASRLVPSRSSAVSSPASFNTRPGTPASATSRFDPEPTTSTAISSCALQLSSATSSCALSGRANSSAEPPALTVVRRARG